MTSTLGLVTLLTLVALSGSLWGQTRGQTASATSKKKLVSTLLEAQWRQTPFVLEMAELLAEKDKDNSRLFWETVDFLDGEAENRGVISDEELYKRAVSFASRYVICRFVP